MKLYDSTMAPNPRRVRIFLAEKGVEVPTVQVDIGKAENRQPPYLAKNPLGGVPILELDDGRFLVIRVSPEGELLAHQQPDARDPLPREPD